MTALDATIGDAAANSFATIAQAEDYLSTRRLHAHTWLRADTGRILRHYDDTEEVIRPNMKAASLMWATARLNGLSWEGDRAASTQALAWPRSGTVDQYGTSIASNVIPDNVIVATAEWALFALDNMHTGAMPSDLLLGSLRVVGLKSPTIPPLVSELVSHLTRTGAGGWSRVVTRS